MCVCVCVCARVCVCVRTGDANFLHMQEVDIEIISTQYTRTIVGAGMVGSELNVVFVYTDTVHYVHVHVHVCG